VFVTIEPLWDVIEIEKHLVAHPNDWHVMFFRPKLNCTNVKTHVLGECAQSDEPFTCDLDDIFLCHAMNSAILLFVTRSVVADHQYLRIREKIRQILGEIKEPHPARAVRLLILEPLCDRAGDLCKTAWPLCASRAASAKLGPMVSGHQ
jgi:hypothetical protein